MVSFSITKQVPDTSILPNARHVCGEVGFAPYALPGSDLLGKHVSDAFRNGHEIVIMENHGVVTLGRSLFQAFQRFETLDFCARLILKGKLIDDVRSLSSKELQAAENFGKKLPELGKRQVHFQ